MFDPTAFENMKVVIEGYLYDKDLDGELSIIDRNDVINIAKLSREYLIQFKMRDSSKEHSATFSLKAGIENLSAELLPGNLLPSKQGCFVELQFDINHKHDVPIYEKLQSGFQQIWGERRTVQQKVQFYPLHHDSTVQNRITIKFNRLIIEDQMDDLMEMVDHMVETLIWLDELII